MPAPRFVLSPALSVLLPFAALAPSDAEAAQTPHHEHGATAAAPDPSGPTSAPDPVPPAFHVEVDVRDRTVVLEVGPVDLPAARGYHEPLPPVSVRGVLGVNGWLRSFRVEVVDGRGRAIDAPVLHHAALMAPDQAELFHERTRRIVAFGAETAAIELPGQLGYRIEPTDSVLLAAAFFNGTDRDIEGARLRLVMRYADARYDPRFLPVLPMYMEAVAPGVGTFDVPPGGVTVSHDWSPKLPGRILGLGGHLHPYGVALTLADAATGELLWTGRAEYDEAGELTGVSRTFFLRGLRVDPTRSYRVTAVYENPTGEVVPGAMGHVAGLFLPDDGATVPPLDRTHPDYRTDLYAMTRGGHAHHH